MMASYRELTVCQKAMDLVVRVYAATARFPPEERYGLVQQMRRAAVSIPSNVAEGYGRRTSRQRYNFLENALGSLFELETQIELSNRLGFLAENDSCELADAIRGIGRGLAALMRYVRDEAHQETGPLRLTDWRRRVGIEPTFRRFRAETTVLKTAEATRPHSPPKGERAG